MKKTLSLSTILISLVANSVNAQECRTTDWTLIKENFVLGVKQGSNAEIFKCRKSIVDFDVNFVCDNGVKINSMTYSQKHINWRFFPSSISSTSWHLYDKTGTRYWVKSEGYPEEIYSQDCNQLKITFAYPLSFIGDKVDESTKIVFYGELLFSGKKSPQHQF